MANTQQHPSITYVHSSPLRYGGAEILTYMIAKHFFEQGWKIRVVLPEASEFIEDYRKQGIPVDVFVGSSGQVIRRLWSTYRAIAKHQPQLLDATEICEYRAALVARWLNIPFVCHVRSILERTRWVDWASLTALRIGKPIYLTASQAVSQTFLKSHAHPHPSKVQVGYDPPPDLSRFNPDRVANDLRAELGIAEDTLVIGSVGAIAPHKGTHYVLESARILRQSTNLSVVVLLAGSLAQTPVEYREQLEQLAHSKELDHCVHFLGARDDIPDFLAALDIFVHAPWCADSFPGVILEAMAMAKPVVGFDSGGCGEQVEHGVTGVVTPWRDSTGLAQGLEALAMDAQKRVEMGIAGRNRLLANFTAEKFYERLERVYRDLTGIGQFC